MPLTGQIPTAPLSQFCLHWTVSESSCISWKLYLNEGLDHSSCWLVIPVSDSEKKFHVLLGIFYVAMPGMWEALSNFPTPEAQASPRTLELPELFDPGNRDRDGF